MPTEGAIERRIRVCDDPRRVALCPDDRRRVQVCDTTDPIAAVMRARISIPYAGLVSIVNRACGTTASGYAGLSPLVDEISTDAGSVRPPANVSYSLARPLRCSGQPPIGNTDPACDFGGFIDNTVDCSIELGRNENQQITSITFIAQWEVAFKKSQTILDGTTEIYSGGPTYCPDNPPSTTVNNSAFVFSHPAVAVPAGVPQSDPSRFVVGGTANARLRFAITPSDAPPPPIPFEYFSALIQGGSGEFSVQAVIPETNPTGYTLAGIASGVFGGLVPYSRTELEAFNPVFVSARAILAAPMHLPGRACSFVDCSDPLWDCCNQSDGVCNYRTVFLCVKRACIGEPCDPDPPVDNTLDLEVVRVEFFP